MNEFVARNGLIALDSSSISGPFVVTGSIYASSGISTGGSITTRDMIITGSSNNSGTNALLLQNSDNNAFIRARNDGRIIFGSLAANAAPFIQPNNGTNALNIDGSHLYFGNANNDNSNAGPAGYTFDASFAAAGGGESKLINLTGTFSGNTAVEHTVLRLSYTINQVVGATGVTRGLYVNPTLTRAANFRAVEWSNNAATAPSQSWGLYGAGSAPNYLAGNLGIGATSISAKLHVNGNVYVQGSGNILDLEGGAKITGQRFVNGSEFTYLLMYNVSDASINMGTQHPAGYISFQAGSGTYIERMRITNTGNIGIGTTSPAFRLDINGSFRSSGSITATSGSDYFDISHDITQPAQTGSQVYEVNITPTLRYTAPNQTQTALRVAATFTGSTALSSSQSNIIADFGSTSAGSQFLVNDVTSGSIYMVNDVSGLPIIEANSNWDVMIYDYPNVVLRKTGSTIDISGSLRLNGSSLDTGWTAYTPVWTAASTNPVIGNGTIEGYYKVIGKTCFVRGNIAMGSSTTFGTGEWYVSMPFTASNADAILMTATLLDNGSAWYNATLVGARAGFNNRAPIQYQTTGGTAADVNATQPFTWVSTDRFIWNGSYEIA